MGKNGSQKTETSVPEFVTDAGKFGVDRAKQLAEIGYMPYYGPDVAALSPMQYAGMQNTNQSAGAFGMAAPGYGGGMQSQGGGQGAQMDPMTGLPMAQNFGGTMAYSAGPMYDEALAQLEQRRPGQYEAFDSMFVDPQTGQMVGQEKQKPKNLWEQMEEDLPSHGRKHGLGQR